MDLAVSDIKEMLHPRIETSRPQHTPESEISLRVGAFKTRAHSLVQMERKTREQKVSTFGINIANSNSGPKPSKHIVAQPDVYKSVLTLYGNAQGSKQLFSSLQKPTTLNGDGKKLIQSLREAALPNGISTTQIIPVQSTGLLAGDKKRVATLGELFAASSTLPAMQPPQPSKLATTRSNTVGWYIPAAKDTPLKGSGYSVQPIAAGQWLDYSRSTPPQDVKRRQRDRAMSLGGSKAPVPDLEPEESEAVKLEALFRSAYSSFAPTKDDSGAVASDGHMNRIWWQNVGERSFERLVEDAAAERVIEKTQNLMEVTSTLEDLDIEKLQEMVDEMEQDTIDPSLVPLGPVVEKSAEEKDADEVLADISGLLETLFSYQRNRHKSLNASARSGGILATADASSTGTPSKPSEPEQSTYEMLRTALELMIKTLPPYAVAKLDANRLAELSISTKIEIQREDYKGVMEEDEASARAKAALAAASSASRATPVAPVHRTSSTNQLYSGTPYAAPRPSGPQYYGNAQTPIRPPGNLQRPTQVSAPFQPRPVAVPSPAYRPSYGTPNYPHQGGARPVQTPQYGGTGQQYQQPTNPQSYMRQPQPQGYSQPTHATPQGSLNQGAMNGGYPRQSFPHQSPAPSNGMNYQYNPANNHPRQASPHKMYTPQASSAQARPYGTPTPTPSAGPSRAPYLQHSMPQTHATPTHQNPQAQPMSQAHSMPQSHSMPQAHTMPQVHSLSQGHSITQNHMNGTPSQTPQPAYPRQSSGTGAMNYSTFMTTQEQSNILERQRAQLAQQQGFQQQQARSTSQAGLGSPSKAPVNGNYSVTAGQ